MSYPIAIIVTSRLGDVSLASDMIQARIDLHGLSKEEMASLAEYILGGVVSPELNRVIVEKSEGNPYFVEQIIRYFQEEGVLEMSREGWSPIGKPRETILPGDIRAVLIARLDQLTREVRETIQTAAVLGREFEVRVLSQMLRNQDWVWEHIAEAEKAAVWVKLTEIRYLFSHGLLRDAAYTMQMRARRQELHTLAMDALETLYADNLNGRYAELAYHAEAANIAQKARTYYTLAGKEAAGLFQNSQAVDYFSRALLFTSATEIVTRYDLVFERVALFSLMGKRDLQIRDIEFLSKWADQLNDSDRIAKALMLRSAYHYFVGNYQDAIDCAKRAEGYPVSFGDTELVLYTRLVWSISLFRLGHLGEAMAHAKKSLERARHAGSKKETSRILSSMGWIALEQNQPTVAQEYLLEALAIAREVKQPGLESRALNQLAILEGSVNGNYALASEYYGICYELYRKVGDRYMESNALANLGFAAGMQGNFETARSCYEQSLAISREIGDLNQEVFILVNLSAVTGIQNEADAALIHAQRAGELARKISERSGEAWAELYTGHAHLLLNDIHSARDAYRKSIVIRDELGQTSLSMEPLAGLVESYLHENDLDSALQMAEKILSSLESGSNLDGTDEPLRVYHACYLALEKKRDPRSRQVLQVAMATLESQVSNFKDADARRRYIENIPWRRAIRDDAQSLLD